MTTTLPGSSPLPSLAVGCMNFGKRTAPEESIRIVARALERGLTWFDTANVYNEGESEKILGRARGADRAKCFVATKVGLARPSGGKPEGLRPERVLRAMDESLSRLGTDHVDLYYLHAPDQATPLAETLDAVAELLASGKARAWGMSNFASWQVLDAMNLADARGIARPLVAQQIYNAMIRQLDVEWFSFAKAHPIHTTVYNPLAGGLLTGKHTKQTEKPAPGSRFDGNGMYMRRYWSERMFDFARALEDVAKGEGTSIVELAYAWVAGRSGVDSILLGPASVEQLEAGIGGCARAVSPAARKKIDELHRSFQGTDATYAR
jgi:aryl-alcohol dehydrogenase-like predicted oxidoreductase